MKGAQATGPRLGTKKRNNATFRLAGNEVPAGETRQLELPISRLPTGSWMSLPVTVMHGRFQGPRLCLCAAVHGDELNGVEIIRQVLAALDPANLRATVVAVPVVNVFGVIGQSRYMPDRRDLNRSFPGSATGSLASRLAYLFTTEVLSHCDSAIDFHTGSNHRTNLPQIRADLDHEPTRELARAFAAPVSIGSRIRDGSLRAAAIRHGIPMLLFEGGETNRFNEDAIEAGVQGTMRVLHKLKAFSYRSPKVGKIVRADTSRWVRAGHGGFFHQQVRLGDSVGKAQELGTIADVFGEVQRRVRSPVSGVIIGQTTHPLVNRGDALVHIAETPEPFE